MKRRALLQTAGLAAVSGCVPMTFSHDPSIDFDLYKKVGVDVRLDAVSAFYGTDRASGYLADELERDSGFEQVTVDLTEEDIDLYLSVDVSLIERVVEDDYGFIDLEYEAQARYVAQDNEGAVIDSGSRYDVSQFPTSAIEFTLDRVAVRYFRPYRL